MQVKGGNLAAKLTSYPKTLVLFATVALFLTWPRNEVASCPATGTRYGIMMDAGSTGSRTHIFEFHIHESGDMELKREVFEELKPGLSSFKEAPTEGAKSLVPLMTAAVREIPAKLAKCTPVALKATAGLRLIGKKQSEEILDGVNSLFKSYPFYVPNDAAVVMDGKDEGPYAWLTVNFLLGTLNDRKSKTAAIFDMGGASTQLVFEPDNVEALRDAPRENIYEISLRGKRFKTYQHSHLGYGLKEATKAMKRLARGTTNFACFPQGFEDKIDGETVSNADGTSDFAKCVEYAKKILNKETPCSHSSCSFKGVYQPSIPKTFSGPIYAFSYFYDRMEPFLNEDGVTTLGEMRSIGTKICSNAPGLFAERNKGTMCMDFAYLHTLMSVGYEIPDTATLHIKKKIKGIETAWALGAMLVALEN